MFHFMDRIYSLVIVILPLSDMLMRVMFHLSTMFMCIVYHYLLDEGLSNRFHYLFVCVLGKFSSVSPHTFFLFHTPIFSATFLLIFYMLSCTVSALLLSAFRPLRFNIFILSSNTYMCFILQYGMCYKYGMQTLAINCICMLIRRYS